MNVLVCNAGSTSLKCKLYDMPGDTVLAQCGIERVGSENDALFHYRNNLTGKRKELSGLSMPDYKAGVRLFLDTLTGADTKEPAQTREEDGSADGLSVLHSVSEVERVGFKTTLSKGHFGVHELNEETLQGMRDWYALTPVHTKAYLSAIEVLRAFLPDALFVGVFETGFHETIPLERRLFGVPYEWHEKYGLMRLGYHGASHGYIADVLNEKSRHYRAISCHLGGSGSVCAIKDGKSIDVSFGMSLESGLIHNNRVGDIDGSIWDFLRGEGLSEEEIRDGFRKKGGLLGISGVSNDLRYVIAAADQGNERARLAVDVYVSGIVHYIGAFYPDLGGLDYLVFTAGIGEHSDRIRAMVCERLPAFGVKLDPEKNRNASGEAEISAPDSKVRVFVIPTDEELGIARRTYAFDRRK